MNQLTQVLLQKKVNLYDMRYLNWPSFSNREILELIDHIIELSHDKFHKYDYWSAHDLLMFYTNIFIHFKITYPNLAFVTRELDVINSFIVSNVLPNNRLKYAKNALWLAAKWGYDDRGHVSKCIQILSNEMRNGKVPSAEELANMLWSYASLLPFNHRPKVHFLSLWEDNFERVFDDIPIDSHLWIQLIPALEFFGIPLPYGKSIQPYFEKYLSITQPVYVSSFEKDVEANLVDLGVKFHTDAKISIYSPDFVIEYAGKRLVLECDGEIYHPFPNLLRNKIFALHGYYVTHITDEDFPIENTSKKLELLTSIIKELAEV